MPEPEDSASEDLNPEPDNTTPDDAAVDATLYEAKIAQLTAQIAEHLQTIDALNAEIVAQKAANYDLLIAGGDTDDETDDVTEGDDETDVDESDVTIDDILYEKEN